VIFPHFDGIRLSQSQGCEERVIGDFFIAVEYEGKRCCKEKEG
jgi:hypothetical protein